VAVREGVEVKRKTPRKAKKTIVITKAEEVQIREIVESPDTGLSEVKRYQIGPTDSERWIEYRGEAAGKVEEYFARNFGILDYESYVDKAEAWLMELRKLSDEQWAEFITQFGTTPELTDREAFSARARETIRRIRAARNFVKAAIHSVEGQDFIPPEWKDFIARSLWDAASAGHEVGKRMSVVEKFPKEAEYRIGRDRRHKFPSNRKLDIDVAAIEAEAAKRVARDGGSLTQRRKDVCDDPAFNVDYDTFLRHRRQLKKAKPVSNDD
jgi:hypothetical protein